MLRRVEGTLDCGCVVGNSVAFCSECPDIQRAVGCACWRKSATGHAQGDGREQHGRQHGAEDSRLPVVATAGVGGHDDGGRERLGPGLSQTGCSNLVNF